MRCFLLGAVATCAALAAGVSSCVAVRSRDLPDPGDSDLLLARVQLRPEEDGYPALQRAIDGLSDPAEDADLSERVKRTLRGQEEVDSQIERIVAANRAALADLRLALESSRLRIPERDPLEEPFTRSRLPLLTRILLLEAHGDARRGHAARSLRTHLDAIALGHRLETAEAATLLDVMQGLSLKNIASESLRGVLSRLEIEPEESRSLARELVRYRSSPEAWSRMWGEEYRTNKKILSTAWAAAPHRIELSLHPLSWLPPSYTYQPNRTLRSLAAFHRTWQEVSSLPCARIPADSELATPKGWDLLLMVMDRNSIGNVGLAIAMPNFARFQERRCLADTSLAATQALVGLRAYQQEHGDLPDALTALVPHYLESLPRDGSDDEVLRYSRGARRLHSPGSDRVDRGGDAAERDGDEFMREPTYPIRF